MFDIWCPVVDSRVLRWSSDIVSVTHPVRGAIDLLIRCDCGQLVLVRTGRARRRADETIHGVDAAAVDGMTTSGVGLAR